MDEGVNPDYIAEVYLPREGRREAPKKPMASSDSEGELDIQNAVKAALGGGGETRLAKDLFPELDESSLDRRMQHLDEIFERLPQTPNYVP